MGAIKMSVIGTLKNYTEVFFHSYSCNCHISQLSGSVTASFYFSAGENTFESELLCLKA